MIIFNENIFNDIKLSTSQLIDENQIIQPILLMIKDEIVKSMSQYIDLLYDKPYVKKLQDSENGVNYETFRNNFFKENIKNADKDIVQKVLSMRKDY